MGWRLVSCKQSFKYGGMHWIDTHCHLEKFTHPGELEATLTRADQAGVGELVTVGTEPDDWSLYHDLAAAQPDRIAYTVGLHPCSVQAQWREAVALLEAYWQRNCLPVALGEIGLDYYHLPDEPTAAAQLKAWQHEAFHVQLELAAKLDCPVVIHSRGAFEDCLKVLKDSGVKPSRVVFHCFTEGEEAIRRLNAYGARASFTGIITYKNAPDVRAALLTQPQELLMLETDAPYLAPVPQRGKRNEPAFLAHTGAYCADLLGCDAETLAAVTTANARAFYGLTKD